PEDSKECHDAGFSSAVGLYHSAIRATDSRIDPSSVLAAAPFRASPTTHWSPRRGPVVSASQCPALRHWAAPLSRAPDRSNAPVAERPDFRASLEPAFGL